MGSGIKKILNFYISGFKSMTVGKYLWLIILVKLFIMFAILKLFFFKNELGQFKSNEEKASHVKEQLIEKSPSAE